MNRLVLSFFITLALYILLLWALWFDARHATLPPHHARYNIQGLKILKPIPKPLPTPVHPPKPPAKKPYPSKKKAKEAQNQTKTAPKTAQKDKKVG